MDRWVFGVALATGMGFVAACDGGGEDSGGSSSEAVLCDTEATRAVTRSTSRAGEVATCSEAWVLATDEPRCVAPADCQAQGKACVKTPGKLTEQCSQRCGDGTTVCPEGMTCLQCEDSEPHCSTKSSCPDPRYPQFDGHGNACTWTPNCTDTPDCCSTSDGRASICVETFIDFTTREDYVSRTCEDTCETSSDCPDGFCCLPYDKQDPDGTAQIKLLGAHGAYKVCWPPNIYDFCKSATSSGGTSGGGSGGSSGGGSSGGCGKCGTYGSHGSCCGPPFCAGDCIGSPCCS